MKNKYFLLFLLFYINSYAYGMEVNGINNNYIDSNSYMPTSDNKETSPIISFVDDIIKNICISQWDVNGDGELSEYEAASVTYLGDAFKGNREIITFDELKYFTGLKKIGIAAFSNCRNLSSIVIPQNVESIEQMAFYSCYQLETVELPNSLVTIGNNAFAYCKSLTSINLPEGVERIREKAFSFCERLQSIVLPNSVTSVDDYAFEYCYKLNTIVLSSNLSVLRTGLFKSCHSLKTIEIPTNILSVKDHCFQQCKNLEYVLFANPNTTIGEWVFGYCQNLKYVSLPSNLTSIPYSCFYDCKNLSTIELPSSIHSIGTIAFESCTVLNSIKSDMTEPFSYPSNVFNFVPTPIPTLYIPKGTKEKYIAKFWSKHFNEIIEVDQVFSLSVQLSDHGSASCENTNIRNTTKSISIEEGSSALIKFSPDYGYQIKCVTENGIDRTELVTNNYYAISCITQNTTLAVEFEAIPPTMYTLSIQTTGSGSATYNGTTVRNTTKDFSVEEKSSATVSFSPDNGYKIKSVKVNGTDRTSYVANNKYTISSITQNTTLEVEFEAIPSPTYTLLFIQASGNGYAYYSSTNIRDRTQAFTVEEGASATIIFMSDNGYR